MKTTSWTYGCEFELADWDTQKGWLQDKGFTRDPEPNIGNTNGIATDPTLKSYKFGGEVCTPPTDSTEGQVEALLEFLNLHPNAVPTYRSGLHVHIRVPGLQNNLKKLKILQTSITRNTNVYPLIDVMPEVPKGTTVAQKEERKRWNWMKMSHWTKIPEDRVRKQLKASTTKEFFEAEVPQSKGKPHWACQPRAAVNLRQLLQTDTIEFRHWTMSIDPDEVLNAVNWCRDYLELMLQNAEQDEAVALFEEYYSDKAFPKLCDYPFSWEKEQIWRATSISKNPRAVIEANIQKVLEGTWKSAHKKTHSG